MAHKAGILIVHGMGKHDVDYADKFISAVRKRIKKKGGRPEKYCFKSAYWHTELQQREDQLLTTLQSGSEMDFTSLRKFVISSFGDPIAYLGRPGISDYFYNYIHKCIGDAIQELRNEMESEECPLVIVAASLGTVIVSNYVWDKQTTQIRADDDKFTGIHTLTGLITLGSNLPLFTLALKKDQIEAINFPVPGLSAELKEKAKWINVYDKDDILGYPLSKLSKSYKVVQDVQKNIGGILFSWNPASHLKYWSDKKIHKLVSSYLLKLLNS